MTIMKVLLPAIFFLVMIPALPYYLYILNNGMFEIFMTIWTVQILLILKEVRL